MSSKYYFAFGCVFALVAVFMGLAGVIGDAPSKREPTVAITPSQTVSDARQIGVPPDDAATQFEEQAAIETDSQPAPEKPVEFQSSNEAVHVFLTNYGPERLQAKDFLVSDPSSAVPVLIQTLADLGGLLKEPSKTLEVSSVLTEIGDEALPELRDAKARIDSYLKEELMQRAYGAAAYGGNAAPSPVVHTLTMVRASIELAIENIETKKN